MLVSDCKAFVIIKLVRISLNCTHVCEINICRSSTVELVPTAVTINLSSQQYYLIAKILLH
jgi:hypothetical protein